MLLLLLACAGSADKGDTADTTEAAFSPDVAAGACDMPAYDWVPLDQMGAIVDAELQPSYSLSAETISTLLEANGAGQFAPVPYGALVYLVRYTTQDRGQVVETTGFLAFPDTPEPLAVPMLAWTHGTTGFTDACAPTAMGFDGAAWPIVFAALGFAVAAPDYLGLNGFGDPAGFLHPYLVPEPTAVATLDSLRALVTLAGAEGTNATPDPSRVVMWGPSEGGFAALWADRYAAHYAPEFTVVATAAPVAPTDVLGLGTYGAGTFGPTTGAMAATVIAMNDWYGNLGDVSTVLVEPFATNLAADLSAGCSWPSADAVTSIEEVLTPTFVDAALASDWDAVTPFGCYLKTASLRETAVSMTQATPTLVVLGEADDLVPAAVVAPDLLTLCDQGMHIEHHTCAGLGHVDAATTSLPYQLAWIQARLAGDPLEGDCVLNAPADCSTL